VLQLPRAHDGDPGEGYGLMTAPMVTPDTVQHINVKVFVDNAADVHLEDAIPVFHQWIRDTVTPELLIDVADYLHVPQGPGILLIGHEANYRLDEREGRVGLLYNRKAELDGDFQSRLEQAHTAALAACERLEKDPAFGGKLKFDRNAIEVFVNDRLLAPNTDETWHALKPELEKYFAGAKIARSGEPRDLFRVTVSK
jgi:hypothetical protein